MSTDPGPNATGREPAPAASAPLLVSAVVAALGGLLFGFDTAVISGTTDALKSVYSLNETTLGFTVAIALIGTIIGAASAGRPADAYGRRAALVGIAVLYLVSAVGSALAWDWYSFLFFRFIGGIGVGGASVVAPM
ncbi:MAG TPA: MFS transporter, partial [Gemmataceae bacterium]